MSEENYIINVKTEEDLLRLLPADHPYAITSFTPIAFANSVDKPATYTPFKAQIRSSLKAQDVTTWMQSFKVPNLLHMCCIFLSSLCKCFCRSFHNFLAYEM